MELTKRDSKLQELAQTSEALTQQIADLHASKARADEDYVRTLEVGSIAMADMASCLWQSLAVPLSLMTFRSAGA